MSMTIGKRLFAGRALKRYLDTAPAKITRAARFWHDEEALRGDALVEKLREKFCLASSQVDMITSIDVRAQATPYVNSFGDTILGHLAFARLPFSGSAVFFEAPVAPDFKPRFAFRLNQSTLKLMTFVRSLDVTEFRDEAVAETYRLRSVLEEIRPRMREQDQEVLRLVKHAVSADCLD